jgi:hypothetical protein
MHAYRREHDHWLRIALSGKAEGVLVSRVKRATKETRDRAERGSAVRGSAGASVRLKRTPSAVPAEIY